MVKNINRCSNPKCITNHENYAKPKFVESNKHNKKYICEFCSFEQEKHK
ncbi:MAG: hypothetical protein ACRC41_03600 [Sarcina sp.]